jgi:eight-cysteine-cluster-containing protein
MACRPALRFVTCVAISVLVAVLGACSPLPKEGGSAGSKPTRRVAAVPSASPNYDHFEGIAFSNSCDSDAECHAAGCSKEVCSADQDVTTTCNEYPDQPKAASCGCVRGLCIWYVSSNGAAPVAAALPAAETDRPVPVRERPDGGVSSLPDQGFACPNNVCAPGLDCMTYFGPGGPKAGAKSTCEMSCLGNRPCPKGQTCSMVKDGPGQVCRPEVTK